MVVLCANAPWRSFPKPSPHLTSITRLPWQPSSCFLLRPICRLHSSCLPGMLYSSLTRSCLLTNSPFLSHFPLIPKPPSSLGANNPRLPSWKPAAFTLGFLLVPGPLPPGRAGRAEMVDAAWYRNREDQAGRSSLIALLLQQPWRRNLERPRRERRE